ncbi:nucleoside hydrolase [Goodfellowiella coeruleoviolacea]|uniref:Pyrimidine-specific ribonucleoside hydrolase n=1 Tax=Goodfellowiella coeruleoviolacea TaxID=334858 RepID=A0AAE3KI37_9PSEU|nr:nucleoside hydrolase [Goodfellowiella coeruleoviolacea]MCP2167029.1 pyrimidine-specific ribonucleoside hydrolase [Goodfellowiella coeruleoviolacea]
MIPLIIDTDPGVDDAFALALALASPEVDLRAVTTVFGNVPLASTTDNALRLLELCGRPDVPVAAGADRPLVHPHPHRARYAHGSDGLSGRASTLPTPSRAPAEVDAVTLMTEVLTAAEQPVTIAAVGPLTNVALLLAAHPSVRSKIGRLVVMGGGLDVGNVTATSEFNIWSDPEAARRVLVEEDLPTVVVPLDLTLRCGVDLDWLAALDAASQVGSALVGLTADYQRYYQRMGWQGTVLHDAVAVAEAVSPGLLTSTSYPVDVDCTTGPARGALLADRRSALISTESGVDQRRRVDIALDADLDRVRAFVLDRLRAL